MSEPGQPYVSPDDLSAIPGLWADAVAEHIRPVIAEVYLGTEGAVHAQMVEAVGADLPNPGSLAAETYLAAAVNTMTDVVGDDLWDTARAQLLEGFQAGESIDALAGRLRGAADLAAPKATLLARTVALDASNAASLATARAAGIPMRKGWLATPDSRTRLTHRLAGAAYGSDDLMIDLGERFQVGGFDCDRPHDPTLPAEERANCRCALVYSIPDSDHAGPGTDVEPARERAARVRQARLDEARGMAELVTAVDEIVANQGSPRAVAARIRTQARLGGITDEVRDELLDVVADPERLRALAHARAAAAGIVVEGRAGQTVTFDPALHESIGGPVQAGTSVVVIRPGTRYVAGGEDVRVARAAVLDVATAAVDLDLSGWRERWLAARAPGGVMIAADGGDPVPWHIERGNSECPDGFAVVKDDDGTVEGCHDSRAGAVAQLRALYVNDESTADREADTTIAAMAAGSPWEGVLISEGAWSGDGRQFAPGSLTWAPLPLALKWQPEEAPGHDGAVIVGRIDEIFRDGPLIRARGVMDDDGLYGAEALRLMRGGMLRGVSITGDDCDESDIELVFPETPMAAAIQVPEEPMMEMPHEPMGEPRIIVHKGRIRSATLIPEQAFVEAEIRLVAPADDAVTLGPTTVTAAGYTITIPELWPEEWFDEPPERPPFGALHITPRGRVYGLLAPANVTHRAFRASGRAVTAPKGVDYSEFQNKPALVAGADGPVRINAGTITFGCGHPSPTDPRRADPGWAMSQYDNTCSVAARVRVGEYPDGGTWVAGGLLHGIDADTVERMMGCALSGDWQNGKLNAALLVPVEGFPVPAAASVRVRDDALVSSTVPVRFTGPAPDLRPALERIARGIGRDRRATLRRLHARVKGG